MPRPTAPHVAGVYGAPDARASRRYEARASGHRQAVSARHNHPPASSRAERLRLCRIAQICRQLVASDVVVRLEFHDPETQHLEIGVTGAPRSVGEARRPTRRSAVSSRPLFGEHNSAIRAGHDQGCRRGYCNRGKGITPGLARLTSALVETNRPVEAVVAVQLKLDAGRSRLLNRRSRAKDRRGRAQARSAADGRHSPRSAAAASPREAVASSPRARALPLLVHFITVNSAPQDAGVPTEHQPDALAEMPLGER